MQNILLLKELVESFDLDLNQEFKLLPAQRLTVRSLEPEIITIITGVSDKELTVRLQKILKDRYQADHKFYLYNLDKKECLQLRIDELDEIDSSNFGLKSLIYLPKDLVSKRSFKNLLEIMALLRSEEGCPWDQKQDHQSIKYNLIEEAYEVLDRIEKSDYPGLVEELGDLLLQVVFHAQIAQEETRFNIYDIIDEINQKLIRRHPHVFAKEELSNSDEVLKRWAEIKEAEKGSKDQSNYLLDDVADYFPALMEAERIQKKVAKIGFDWPEVEAILVKLAEEVTEFKEAYQLKDLDKIKEELGDLLFTVVNIARFLDLKPELLLKESNQKFRDRFNKLEELVKEQDKNLNELSLAELDRLWTKVKTD